MLGKHLFAIMLCMSISNLCVAAASSLTPLAAASRALARLISKESAGDLYGVLGKAQSMKSSQDGLQYLKQAHVRILKAASTRETLEGESIDAAEVASLWIVASIISMLIGAGEMKAAGMSEISTLLKDAYNCLMTQLQHVVDDNLASPRHSGSPEYYAHSPRVIGGLRSDMPMSSAALFYAQVRASTFGKSVDRIHE